jgi:hypothetical protein
LLVIVPDQLPSLQIACSILSTITILRTVFKHTECRMRLLILALIGLASALAATPTAAQGRIDGRIEVRPRSNLPPLDWNDPLRWRPLTPAELRASARLVRVCTDGYVLERRPSGTVLTPRMYCRWATR